MLTKITVSLSITAEPLFKVIQIVQICDMFCFFCFRRQAKSAGGEHTSGARHTSASSREGGDEYSSEASEFDSTKNVRETLLQNYKACYTLTL